ncbi:MAG TPA: hypothetical protein VF294_06135, partial [Polyangiaceae bacterium]
PELAPPLVAPPLVAPPLLAPAPELLLPPDVLPVPELLGPAPESLLPPQAVAHSEIKSSPAPRPIAVQRISRNCHALTELPIPPCAMHRNFSLDRARNGAPS